MVDSLAPMISRPAELSRSSASELSSSCCRLSKAAGVVEHGAAGVGQDEVLAGAVDQLLAQFLLQPLQRQRHRGLRAQQLLGRAREALLRGDRQKHLKRIKFHGRIHYNIC